MDSSRQRFCFVSFRERPTGILLDATWNKQWLFASFATQATLQCMVNTPLLCLGSSSCVEGVQEQNLGKNREKINKNLETFTSSTFGSSKKDDHRGVSISSPRNTSPRAKTAPRAPPRRRGRAVFGQWRGRRPFLKGFLMETMENLFKEAFERSPKNWVKLSTIFGF